MIKRSKNHQLDTHEVWFFERITKNGFCQLNHTLYPTPSMIFNASIIHFLNTIYVCRKRKAKAKSNRWDPGSGSGMMALS
jgi:hypothetical protein